MLSTNQIALNSFELVLPLDSSVTSITLLHRLSSDEQDQVAWQEFVDRYGSRIYDWCINRKLNSADAQDVSQEILLKLAGHMRAFEYDSKQSFRGWLRRLTENAIIDFFRAKKLDAAVGGSSLMSLANEPARADLVGYLAEVFDLDVMEEAKSRVQKRVTEKRWLSWHLLTHTSMSGKEVAQQLDISVGTAYANKNQIQKLIKAEIELLDRTIEP